MERILQWRLKIVLNVTDFGGEDCRAVVITEGSQIGAVDYSEDE